MNPTLTLWIEIAKLVFAGVALVSAYFAFKTYQANVTKQADDRIREADKELVGQAQRSLQWAFDALTDSGRCVPPKSDRVNWLTCARHLLRHQKIAERIQSEPYHVVHEEHEEYWRHRFYLALNHLDLMHPNYFARNDQELWYESIEIASALVVIDFSNWPKGNADPLDAVDCERLAREGKGYRGMAGCGLEEYVSRQGKAPASNCAE